MIDFKVSPIVELIMLLAPGTLSQLETNALSD
jgi:hypothetical protein